MGSNGMLRKTEHEIERERERRGDSARNGIETHFTLRNWLIRISRCGFPHSLLSVDKNTSPRSVFNIVDSRILCALYRCSAHIKRD